MKKLLFLLVFSFAFFNMIKADVAAVDDPIILIEKFDNPIVGHEGPSKSPTLLYMSQSGNVFFFDQSYEGCAVSLLLNDVVVYSAVVDEDGLVTLPDTFSGTYELQLAVGDVIYWAMVEL